MARAYEYWTVKDGEDIAINLTITSFLNRKGNFSSQAETPDEYFGTQEIDWETKDDISFMSESDIAAMKEWLFNEHSEYIDDQNYHE